MLDPPDDIRRKFKIAVTDSGREIVHAPDKPGISNLIEIMTVATGERSTEIQDRYDGQGYGAFKTDVARRPSSRSSSRSRRASRRSAATPASSNGSSRSGAEKAAEASASDARGDVRAHGLRPPLS